MLISDSGSWCSFSKTAILVFGFCCLGGEVKAQKPMPGAGEYSSPGPADYVPLDHEIGHEGTGGGSGPNGVPIDGGAGWLLAAGAGYGIKRLRDRRKQKGEETSEAENGETEIDEQQQEL